MSDLLARVAAYVRQHDLLAPGSAVVVGVSGGPDSVCLLHLLRRLAGQVTPGVRLHVAHLHHQLRGADADADAQFVADLAASWGVPCTVGRADVSALAQQPGLSLEEAARQARYAFLAETARANAADTIAVGHHADDQAETVLMHFLRGSGVAGLRGMLPVTELVAYRLAPAGRPSTGEHALPIVSRAPAQDAGRPQNADAALRLIRPLLHIPRADILAYCEREGLAYRVDRSNEDTTFYRNRLRHELLPLLETYNPAIRAVLCHTAEAMAGDYEVLRVDLERAWERVVLPAGPDGPEHPERVRDSAPVADYRQPKDAPEHPERVRGSAPVTQHRQPKDAPEHPERVRGSTPVTQHRQPKDEIQFDLAAWRGLPVGLQRGLVREAVHRLRHSLRNINWEHVERAVRMGREGRPGQAATLAAGLALQVGTDRLRIAAEGTAPHAETDGPQLTAPRRLAAPGVTALAGGWQVVVSRLAKSMLPRDFTDNADPWRAWLDMATTGPDLVLRPRVPGDRLQPQGMGGHSVRLNELMINLKVPRVVRAGWPILVGQAGIAWVCGLRLDERAAVGPETAEVWQVTFQREQEGQH